MAAEDEARRLRERLIAADNLLKQAGLRSGRAWRRAEQAYRAVLAEAERAGLQDLARLARLRLEDLQARGAGAGRP